MTKMADIFIKILIYDTTPYNLIDIYKCFGEQLLDICQIIRRHITEGNNPVFFLFPL